MILVTGGTGFIGSALVNRLASMGEQILYTTRKAYQPPAFKHQTSLIIPTIDGHTDWTGALDVVSLVIHTAARVHVMYDNAVDPLAEFRRVNVSGTLNLARQAAASGVRRFVFISSIGVNGNSNTRPFTEVDEPRPVEPYALTKLEAEQGLARLAVETGMEVVIIRPPLVYGPNAPGNFGVLLRWLTKGVPLPLGAIDNRRSLVGLGNLADFIITCLDHPAAANQTFLVADGEDLSTTELLRRMAAALGRPARLVPFPQSFLTAGLRIIGKGALAQRLCGSLQVDTGKARTLLGWRPPLSVDQGLAAAARPFLESNH
ncbi:UDP-glucose 4-epimerase family protein [Desulfurivibrio sp. C05AmB]|uniref:UDP-glucose 4-epimerase family protein n=1 Tax=Desulfurivibrio sp. C05AmB TaxID=3374371 RepID=UPI00376EE1F4